MVSPAPAKGTSPESGAGWFAPTAATNAAIAALTAVLYTIGKGLTAYIPTPWLVGQVLVGIFLPAYLAVVSDTVPVAIGAGIGTFVGDVLFVAPAGVTNAPLSLIAGVPANFVAFLLFGWFVKRYRTWSGFVAATVAFVTLGNLIAAFMVVRFASLVFAPAAGLAAFPSVNLILGYTVFWNMTAIPAIIVAVPILIRATRPLLGRSQIVRYDPQWSTSSSRRQTALSLAFALVFLGLGAVFLYGYYASVSAVWTGLDFYVPVAALVVLVFAPLASVIAGAGRQVKQSVP